MNVINKPMRVIIQDTRSDPMVLHPIAVGDLVYVKGEKKLSYVDEINLDEASITQHEILASDLINLALAVQEEKRKTAFVDSEGISHKALLNDIIKHVESQESNVQVLDGGIDTVKLEHFPGDSVGSVMELIHFIEVNELTEKRPWSTVWNLYQCMLIAAKQA